jgi:hypothetical protein
MPGQMTDVTLNCELIASDLGMDRPAYALHRKESWREVLHRVKRLDSVTWTSVQVGALNGNKFVYIEASPHTNFWISLVDAATTPTKIIKCRGIFAGFINSATVLKMRAATTLYGNLTDEVRIITASAGTAIA